MNGERFEGGSGQNRAPSPEASKETRTADELIDMIDKCTVEAMAAKVELERRGVSRPIALDVADKMLQSVEKWKGLVLRAAEMNEDEFFNHWTRRKG